MSKRISKPAKATRAIGYIRMSTDQQEDSPDRQRAEIITLAERENCALIDWYEDHGLTGTESKNRPAFQRMMIDAQRGKFDVILMSEQSRFSREGVFEVFEHWGALRSTGVGLITCQRGRVNFDDLGGIISALVDAHAANDESKKISSRAVSGKAQKLRNGKAMSRPAFAFDREMLDEAGNIVKRVHYAEKFSKPKGWQSRLVATSDIEALDALRWMFAACRDGMALMKICRELNKRGVRVGGRSGKNEGAFCSKTVKRILRNPMYLGTMRYGFRPRGKFNRLDQFGGPFVIENAHEALIDAETFATVQRILDLNGGQKPAKGNYLFRGLLRCGHCGECMYGKFRSDLRQPAYDCHRYLRGIGVRQETHVSIRADWIENVLIEFLRKEFAQPEFKRQIRAAVAAYCSNSDDAEKQDSAKLRSCEELIARVENALFDQIVSAPENVAAIEKRLEALRADRNDLIARMETQSHITKLTPEATSALAVLDELFDRPDLWDRNKLRLAVADVLEYGELSKHVVEGHAPSTNRHRGGRPVKTAVKFRQYAGRFAFKPGIFSVDVLEFTDADMRPGWKLNKAIEFVCAQGNRMVTSHEISTAMAIHPTVVVRLMRKGMLLGRIARVGGQRTGGWIPTECKLAKSQRQEVAATA